MDIILGILALGISFIAIIISITSNRTMGSLTNLEFDEKLAVLAGYKKKAEIDKDLETEKTKNNFRAISNLKKWIDQKRREELIADYIIPIIENAVEKEDVVRNYAKAKALDEMIEIALGYNLETEKLKTLRKKLLSYKVVLK